MDKRKRTRWPLNGALTALCLNPGCFGEMHDLHLLDYGDGGVAAAGPEPIVPGTNVTLGFGPRGYTARRGLVVACTPADGGQFRVAIRFDEAMAA